MNRRTILSVAIIILAFAAIGGGTMAWFTDEVALENTFTAGTLDIEGSDFWTGFAPGAIWNNVNPGDCRNKEFTINNNGTKNALIRFQWDGEWGEMVGNTWTPMVDGDPTLVTVTAPTGWYEHTDGWWYYTPNPADPLAPGAKLEFALKVCIAGAETGNEYQGKSFKLNFTFEAIQASNNASGDLWGVDSLYNPADVMTAANWNGFDF